MRAILFSAAFAFFCSAAATARGDGMLYQLPEDGAWVQFDLTAVSKFGSREEDAKGTLRMASVGRITENREPHRWIEVKFDAKTSDGKNEVLLSKVLVPEKFLKKGEKPLAHVIRAWLRKDDKKPEKIDIANDFRNLEDSPWLVILAGPLKDAKQLDAITVESKRGKLSCAGVNGTMPLGGQDSKGVVSVETRLHDNAPFGVVSSRWVLTHGKEGTMTFQLKLADYGTKAQSELPDQQ